MARYRNRSGGEVEAFQYLGWETTQAPVCQCANERMAHVHISPTEALEVPLGFWVVSVDGTPTGVVNDWHFENNYEAVPEPDRSGPADPQT